jgi:hypothetical protein
MLFSDPAKPHKEISSPLGIPIGAVGPTRAGCLTRARNTAAIAALIVDQDSGCHNPQSDQLAS